MDFNFNTFPAGLKFKNSEKRAVASEIFGNRFHADQTLYEYLIEFLLIFVSEDNEGENKKAALSFHDPNAVGNLYYQVQPRMGLKRFIFFDKNKKGDAVAIDKIAYNELIKVLLGKIYESAGEDEKLEVLESLQDLLHGYAVVLKKRTWCAQAMLPLCPELIFCEAMPAKKKRAVIKWEDVRYDDKEKMKIDTAFDFDKRNFLARGGELYYLHILQGLREKPANKERLEGLLKEQLLERGKKFSKIANFIQDAWEEYMGYEEHPSKRLGISFIPESAYKNIAPDSVDELINYLSCRMHPVKKIELLSKGVMVQIMRMLSVAATNYLGAERECWIIDISGYTGNVVKKIAANSFTDVQNTFTTAIGKNTEAVEAMERLKQIRKARKDSFDIFKSKGKELNCIIPTSGPYERFSLPEDCIRFLVLALIPPQKKMTLDMFLEKLFEKYRIVIGPDQYKKMRGFDSINVALANSFNANVSAFQVFLKATGFLKELSDATSIVVNPYEELKGAELCNI